MQAQWHSSAILASQEWIQNVWVSIDKQNMRSFFKFIIETCDYWSKWRWIAKNAMIQVKAQRLCYMYKYKGSPRDLMSEEMCVVIANERLFLLITFANKGIHKDPFSCVKPLSERRLSSCTMSVTNKLSFLCHGQMFDALSSATPFFYEPGSERTSRTRSSCECILVRNQMHIACNMKLPKHVLLNTRTTRFLHL